MDSLETFIGHKLNRKKNLGWFGLAANPPTLAHRRMIEDLLEKKRFDAIIVFPAGNLRYKTIKVSRKHRLQMLRLWKKAAHFPSSVIISTFDLFRQEAMSWYELWHQVKNLGQDYKHTFILGSDQYDQIEKTWDHGAELKKIAAFEVIPRTNVSSTEVRKGKFDLVDPLVRAYIIKHHLYP